MNRTPPEPESLKLALREIANAREHLRLASEVLSASAPVELKAEASPAVIQKSRQLDIGASPQDLLDIAYDVIHQVYPEQLAQRALKDGAKPRDWLRRVYTLSCVPRGIAEPVTTLVVMLAAVKFGLRHQLLLQTETRLGLAHKTPIANLDLFLETFVAEMLAADQTDVRLKDWLKRTLAEHYPNFPRHKRLELPNGDYIQIPEAIEPIGQQAAGSITPSTLTSPLDPASGAMIPPGSGWRITLGFGDILYAAAYPAYHGKRHSGIDLHRWDAQHKPVYAMRTGLVIESVYLPQGFGNTVVIEHEDGSCLRYTHLEKKLVKQGNGIARGQKIGTVGRGAKDIYAPHLHLDMPRSRTFARARTYYDSRADVAERFIDPLSLIPSTV